MKRGTQNPGEAAGLPPHGPQRRAALAALEALRRSVDHGRPLSLPNFVRLYRRARSRQLQQGPDRLDEMVPRLRNWYQASKRRLNKRHTSAV